jgi:putative inorganic carbon (hco3(-)) transporter
MAAQITPPPPLSPSLSLLTRLADAEILLAPVVALSLLFPTRAPGLVGAGLLALLGVWLIRWRAWRSPWRPTPLNLALLVLLLTVPLATWASAVPDLTVEALAYLIAGLVAFSAVLHWVRAPGRAWWVWGGLAALGVALAALAPLGMTFSAPQVFPLPGFYAGLAGRLPETINANVMAGALVVLWPVCLAGVGFPLSDASAPVSRFARHALRLLTVPIVLLLVATLALAQSRGAYVALGVSGLVWLALRWPRAARVVVPLVLVAALAGGSLVGWQTIADELTTGEASSGLDQRVEIWSRALYAIQDFPFTGLGLGTFERVVAILYPLFLIRGGTAPHAHNLFLQVAVDLGLLGLVAYLALLGLTFSCGLSAYRAFRRQGRGDLAGLCGGGIAGLVGMCVHGLIDATTWGLKLAFIPWAVMGLVVALYLWSARR